MAAQVIEQAELDGKSTIRAAVLAVLLDRPGYGYDLARRVRRLMGASWGLHPRHIYRVLGALERDGLARRERKQLPGMSAPGVVFFATPQAERVRAEWLAMPLDGCVVRSELRARLAIASVSDIPELLRALRERRLAILAEMRENEITDAPRVSWLGAKIGMQRSAVARALTAELEWIDEVKSELEAIVARGAKW